MARVIQAVEQLKTAARTVRRLSTAEKNSALLTLAEAVAAREGEILAANAKDLQALAESTTAAFRDRLRLNPERIRAMVGGLRQVSALPDPVGELVEERVLANGLHLRRVRAPLGVIFMIFESRPNVILEAFSLAFKAGNVIALRGGSESSATSQALYQIMAQVLSRLPALPFYGFEDFDRTLVESLLRREDLIDVVVPRGGEALIQFVQRTALMPLIKNDRGLCHTYVHADADVEMAVRIVANAKTQRPGVCNSLETLLMHQDLASAVLPRLHQVTESVGLHWRVDEESQRILNGFARVRAATAEDWDMEHLDQVMNCKIVAGLDEAIQHIERHGSKHSEAIVTASADVARRFQTEVDAAAVYWNASTRFTDGFEFGLGGELGISTQKLHVRGPVGLRELTTPRWIGDGNGQIRE
ncbi:MAG: glutamate-5-semialdehyde dehydrogenase [Bdellovibrionales bacterium]